MVSKVGKSDIIYLPLTVDEAYTLQVLTGFVAGDKDVYSISSKLIDLTGDELDVCDYDRVSFNIESKETSIKLEFNEDEYLVIRIK